jgi:biotin operon repressor
LNEALTVKGGCFVFNQKRKMIYKGMRHELIRPGIGRVIHILQGTHKRFNDLKRVERVFKLIRFLDEFRTYKEIAAHLNISQRSATRYIHLLLHLGFTIERSMGKYYSFRIIDVNKVFSKND